MSGNWCAPLTENLLYVGQLHVRDVVERVGEPHHDVAEGERRDEEVARASETSQLNLHASTEFWAGNHPIISQQEDRKILDCNIHQVLSVSCLAD